MHIPICSHQTRNRNGKLGNNFGNVLAINPVAIPGFRSFWRVEKSIFFFRNPNRRERKILVVWHGWRHDGLPIESFAFCFPSALEFFPVMFAAPIFLGVKQRDQSCKTYNAKKKFFEIVPGAKPADKSNQQNSNECPTNGVKKRKKNQSSQRVHNRRGISDGKNHRERGNKK